jgi:flagellar operon protein
MIKSIPSQLEVTRSQPNSPSKPQGDGQFAELFGKELAQLSSKETTQGIAFSKHAITRAEQRGIEIDDTLLSQLSDSVEKAQAKGAKNILAFDATRAFIVNVPHGRVITALSQEEMKENIFTNIDGAVIL